MHEERTYEDVGRENGELRQRVNELDRLARATKISEDALKLDEARLEALLKLSQMSGASEQDIANFALEEAVRLTGSEVGWMGALNEGTNLVTLYNFSSQAMKECGVLGRPHSFTLKNACLWAQPIFRREPIIINDYQAPRPGKKGFPEGHMELRNLLAVPVFDDSRVVAVAEVGNKKSDYDWSYVRQLALLMAGVWPIILRKRAEDTLRQAKQQAELYVDLMGRDINNMNQIAIGFMELALQTLDAEEALTEKHRFLLEKPMDTLYNSARLIKNLKKLKDARTGGLAVKAVDLDSVLTSACAEFQDVPGRDITIRFQPAGGRYVLRPGHGVDDPGRPADVFPFHGGVQLVHLFLVQVTARGNDIPQVSPLLHNRPFMLNFCGDGCSRLHHGCGSRCGCGRCCRVQRFACPLIGRLELGGHQAAVRAQVRHDLGRRVVAADGVPEQGRGRVYQAPGQPLPAQQERHQVIIGCRQPPVFRGPDEIDGRAPPERDDRERDAKLEIDELRAVPDRRPHVQEGYVIDVLDPHAYTT
jgi:hypothetical protein